MSGFKICHRFIEIAFDGLPTFVDMLSSNK